MISFFAQEAALETFFLDRFKAELRQRGQAYQIVLASEVSARWVEDNLIHRSLFFSEESLIILQAELLSPEAKAKMAEAQAGLGERVVLLTSPKKDLGKEAVLKDVLDLSLTLTLPPPWEVPKLLDYLATELSYPIAPKIRAYMLDVLDPTVEAFLAALWRLVHSFPNPEEIELELVRELIEKSRVDYYLLAARFARRERGFFDELMGMTIDTVSLGLFFRFMQTYLLKMLDSSYVEKKRSPSKYDRELMALAKGWRPDELIRAMHQFGELEVLAKERSDELEPRMVRLQLQRFSPS